MGRSAAICAPVIAVMMSAVALAACAGNGASPGASNGGSGTTASAPGRPAGSRAPSPSASAHQAPPASEPEPNPNRGTAGASPVTGWLAGKDWTYIPTTRHVVALTFDAGANADAVGSILATLRRKHVTATFFLTGDFVRAHQAAARAIAAAGMRIGDHTMTHPHLTRLGDAAVRGEILGAARQIRAATGVSPVPLFRFPFGDANARTIAIANGLGYVPVRWTVDTLGWEGSAGHISPSIVLARVLAGLRPGEIVLMHVGSNPDDHTTFDADALPHVIDELRARGYSFVTLGALTG